MSLGGWIYLGAASLALALFLSAQIIHDGLEAIARAIRGDKT